MIELRFGLSGIPCLQVSERQLDVGLGTSGFDLQDLLKFLGGLWGLALGSIHLSSQQVRVKVRGTPFEDCVQDLDSFVVPSFGKGDLSEPAPGQEVLGGLLGQLSKDALGPFRLLRKEIEVGQMDLRQRADRRPVGRRLVLLLRPRRVALGQIKVAKRQMGLDGVRFLGDGLFELALRPYQVLLLLVEGRERQVKLGAIIEVHPRTLEALDGFVRLVRAPGRSCEEQQRVQIRRRVLENDDSFCARLVPSTL